MSSQPEENKPEEDLEPLPDRLGENLTCGQGGNKADSKDLHTGSPISPLRTGTPTATTTTSSSSSSSGSFSNPASSRYCPKPPRIPELNPKRYLAERSSESSPSDARKGQTQSASYGSHSASSAPAKGGHTRSASVASNSQSPSAARKGHTRSASAGSNSQSPSAAQKSQATSSRVELPFYGNICPSGVIKTGMKCQPRSTVLSLGTGDYGYGTVVRGKVDEDWGKRIGASNHNDPMQFWRMANDCYSRGDFAEALSNYDKVIAIEPRSAENHFNRSEALMKLGRLMEAAEECKVTLGLDPEYFGARSRLGFLLFRLGQVENSMYHFCYPGQHQDPTAPQIWQKLKSVERHLNNCTNARRIDDWRVTLREVNAAIDAGADASPQLLACKAEALLKLQQLNDAFSVFANVPNIDQSSRSEAMIFGMLFESYVLYVRSQIDLAKGRFEDALTNIDKARRKDPQHYEILTLFDKTDLVVQVRARGNALYNLKRFTEAKTAYDEGLRLDPLNPTLISNRAACWYKLRNWERSVLDCELVLSLLPNHTKSLMRRAAANFELERWQGAVSDYEALLMEFPQDPDIIKAYFHSQVALKKSLGEDVSNTRFGRRVESVSTLVEFSAAISSISAVIVHFRKASSSQCTKISQSMDTLCTKYPYVRFLQVDIETASEIAQAEKVQKVPMIKVYRKGKRVDDMDDPTPELLDRAAKYFHRLAFK